MAKSQAGEQQPAQDAHQSSTNRHQHDTKTLVCRHHHCCTDKLHLRGICGRGGTPVIVLAHGLEGSPEGTKARTLREAGFDLIAPDGRKKPLAQRIDELEEATRPGRELILVGSSYGGLAALVLAHRHPERFHGLVLCAPALILREPPVEDPESLVVSPDLPCIVLHGIHDEIVPIDA
ncbi:MAG: alpha/beta fold hydrolase, partial [Proteobacteria bacterium]|nr:alpha/beta fold hydrolase [Pseudomonadota bacterium]